MNVSLVVGDQGTLALDGRELSLDDLADALRALPAGTSVLITLKDRSEQRRSHFRQVAKLVHEAGLDVHVLDFSDSGDDSVS